MPVPRDFADTNVLLYLLSADAVKAARAEEVLAAKPVVSVQVLNEFASVARRKLAMDWADIAEILDTVAGVCEVQPLTMETHVKARALAQRYQLNFYDSVIAASALIAGCGQLMSEDFQSGLLLEGQLRVRNPFVA
jgi:predicted nucleic acid-binding protein